MTIVRTKPKYTFAQYVEMNPDTKYTKELYCAGIFLFYEVRVEKEIGNVFKEHSGFEWRIVKIDNGNRRVYAVPASYVEEYWK